MPFLVPVGITQHSSRLGEPALHAFFSIYRCLPDNILHITTRGYLFSVPSPLIIKYSDDTLIVVPPHHLLYHPPAPFPDNFIIILAFVSVWAVLFMWQFRAQPGGQGPQVAAGIANTSEENNFSEFLAPN